MIRHALKEEIPTLNSLGLLALGNFTKVYDLENYLNNDSYYILVNEDNEIINGLLIIVKTVDSYELEIIAVKKENQQQGVATKMVNYFIDNCMKKGDKIFLEVAENNEKAIKLYEKLGFTTINRRKKYYNGIDAYVMQKEIR